MADEPRAISKITVRGFKSIHEEQSIEIRPLTLLAGANSSGKSSVMQPLLLLKQTLEAPGDPGALLLDGPNVRFTLAEQLLSHCAGKSPGPGFEVALSLNDGRRLLLHFDRRPGGGGFDVASMHYKGRGAENDPNLLVIPDMPHDEIVKVLPPHLVDWHTRMAGRKKAKLNWAVHRDRCFLQFGYSEPENSRHATRLVPVQIK